MERLWATIGTCAARGDGAATAYGTLGLFPVPLSCLPLTVALSKRIANLALTAQVQLAYACARQAQARAENDGATIAQTWPASPLRTLVLAAYRAQALAAASAARQVLEHARWRCGLAFAKF